MSRSSIIIPFFASLCLIVITIHCTNHLCASELDSLARTLDQLKGKERVKVLNKLTWKLRKTKLDTAQFYGQQAVVLAKKMELWQELVDAHSFLGVVFRNKGNYIYALNNFYQALQISEKHDIKIGIAYSYNNIGDILKRQKKNKEAIQSIHKAIAYFEDLNNKRGEAYGYIRLGEVYQLDSLYDKSLECYQRCLHIRISRLTEDKDGIQSIYNRIGQVYGLTQQYDSSLHYHREALVIAKKINDRKGIVANLTGMAIVYQHVQQYDSTIILAENALKIARELGVTELVEKSTRVLADVYVQKKPQNYVRAYELLQLYVDAQSKLIHEENKKVLKSLKTKYQFEKQQTEISVLNKNRRNQKIVMVMLGLGLLLLVVWLFSIQRISKQRKKDYKKLKKQKTEIETQAEELHKINKEISSQKIAIQEKNTALEDALNKLGMAQSKIAEGEKMASLGQMIAGIAHELNNPINFVYAGTQSIQAVMGELNQIIFMYEKLDTVSEGELNALQSKIHDLKEELCYAELKDDVFQLLNDVSEGASRTAEIVMGLRTFARMDAKKAVSSDIHQSLDSTLVILNNKIREKAKVIKEYHPRLPYVTCYQGKINQVFMNILANAIQAIDKPNGEIRIKTTFTETELVQVYISDNGKGMNEETRNNIFDPFYTTKTAGEGQGLGLAIALEIIENHHGKIEVQSELGTGTTFIVSLPIQAISDKL